MVFSTSRLCSRLMKLYQTLLFLLDLSIAGMVTHERILRSGLSHELDLDRDLFADLALAR